MSQPLNQGALGLGTVVTSALFLVTTLGLVIFLTVTRKDVSATRRSRNDVVERLLQTGCRGRPSAKMWKGGWIRGEFNSEVHQLMRHRGPRDPYADASCHPQSGRSRNG
jgi:hypothetical protein